MDWSAYAKLNRVEDKPKPLRLTDFSNIKL